LQGFEEGGSVEVRGERFERREVRATAFPAKGAKVQRKARARARAAGARQRLCCPNPIY
jgi:hypothetical protein